MPKAFVTGATGFVGYHVARHLLQKGWQVIALRRSGSTHPEEDALPVEWRIGDLGRYEDLSHGMKGCEAVFHVAADYRLWA
ncbi:MAG: NAD-dependent epimerase/dehydratase family protein, partial [Syntrophobacteraceae bacterium]|nr:NAD-dependent epimerase/dehydratase family protein [Syntrophobacteraceae bacterium]